MTSDVTLLLECGAAADKLPTGVTERHYELDKRGVTKVLAAPLCASRAVTPLQSKVLTHKLDTKIPIKVKELQIFRITIIRMFQENGEWKALLKKPEKVLNTVLDTHLAKAYGWREVLGDVIPQVSGFIRVDPAVANALKAFSGKNGVFIDEIVEGGDKPSIFWVKRLPNEDLGPYHQRALKEAGERGKPLVFRRGGSSCFPSKGLKTTISNPHSLSLACPGSGVLVT